MVQAARAGFVLAGGASSRMGANKALLRVNDRPLVVHVAEMVALAAGSATLIGDPAIYGHLGFNVIPDRRAGCGPLAGIEAALENATAEFNLIVACDLPSLSVTLLDAIFTAAESRPEIDVTMPEGPEPLCAIYRRAALPEIRSALDRGTRKVTAAFATLRVALLPVEDTRVFANLNTPGDWQRYTQG